MRFIYIYNNKKWVEIAKIGDPRYKLLREIVNFEPILHQTISVRISLGKVEKRIEEMLPFRLQDIPIYLDEKYIFSNLVYKDKSYKLCNTGYDSFLIFLINIYNAGVENTDEFIVYSSNNHKEFGEWRKNFEL